MPTHKELYAVAQLHNIKGRSKMTKEQLSKAIAEKKRSLGAKSSTSKSSTSSKSTSKSKKSTSRSPAKKSGTLGKTQLYITIDNDIPAFLVKVDGKNVRISKESSDDADWDNFLHFSLEKQALHFDKPVKEYKNVSKIFIGDTEIDEDTGKIKKSSRKKKGNAILLHLSGDKYVFIGDRVYEFTSKDKITTFKSTIGHNGVTYSTALTKTHLYELSERLYALKNDVITWLKNNKFYLSGTLNPYYHSIQYPGKKYDALKVKMINKRIFEE